MNTAIRTEAEIAMAKRNRMKSFSDEARYNMPERLRTLKASVKEQDYAALGLQVDFNITSLDYFVKTVNKIQGNKGWRAYTKMNLLSHIEAFFNVNGQQTDIADDKTYDVAHKKIEDMRVLLKCLNDYTSSLSEYGNTTEDITKSAHKKASKEHHANIYNPPITPEASSARLKRIQIGTLSAAVTASIGYYLYTQSQAPILQLAILFPAAILCYLGFAKGNQKQKDLSADAVSIKNLTEKHLEKATEQKALTKAHVEDAAHKFPRRQFASDFRP